MRQWLSVGDGARSCGMVCVQKQCLDEKIGKLERGSIFDSIDSTVQGSQSLPVGYTAFAQRYPIALLITRVFGDKSMQEPLHPT